MGFDSRDDVLDVMASADLSEWELKDAEELQFALEVGVFTRTEARAIEVAAESAVDDIANRRWPFDQATWARAIPHDALLQATVLPSGWDAP